MARRRQFLTASEAAALLGISHSSLYAYVSRGRLRAELDPHQPRRSRYLVADVEQLRDRKEARLHPDLAARKALDWGIPVLESSLTLIDDGRFYYRGRDAVALARTATFEEVVRLLWNVGDQVSSSEPVPARCRDALPPLRSLPAMQRMQALLPFASADDIGVLDVSAEAQVRRAWRILHVLTAAATRHAHAASASIADSLAAGWRVRAPAARRLLDTALILCADHELNVSAFAARVVASSRSSLYDVTAAGLAALRGPRHGGYTSQVEALLDDAASPRRLRAVIQARLGRGEPIPGFGHQLYPRGDPRARLLFAEVERRWPRSEAAAFARAARCAGRSLLGESPTVDFGLVILRRALKLPAGSALILFALGRTAGWLAHAMEQYASGPLIRPRAAYVGEAPRRGK
jgi:citrate synthase